MKLKPKTEVQELQALVYNLFQKYILTMEGQILQVGKELPSMYISKEGIVENMVKMLNEFGEELGEEK